MLKTLVINGKTLDNLYLEGDLPVSFFDVSTEYQETSHLDRAIFQNRARNSGDFELNLAYVNEKEKLSKFEIAQKVIRFINHNEEVEIAISGEKWFWKGRIDGPFEIDLHDGQVAFFSVKVVLLDNAKYSVDTYKNTAYTDAVTTVNNGTLDTPFILEAVALKESPFFMVSDKDDNHFFIGEDSEEVDIKNYSPPIIKSEFLSTSGFSRMSSTENIPDRYLGGTTGASFKQNPQSWGLNLSSVSQNRGWRGGALSKTYDRSVQDFKATFKVNVRQNNKGTGKIGHFIYDDKGKLIFSMGYQNVTSSKDAGRIVFLAYNEQGDERLLWGPQLTRALKKVRILTIYFTLIRKGNTLTMRYWCYNDEDKRGRVPSTVLRDQKKTYKDNGKIYNRKIANSRFGIFRGNANHRDLRHLGTYIYELLEKPKGSADMIIQQGDTVILNTETGDILVNEEPVMSEKSFSSRYFTLPPGTNELLITPTNTFDTTVYWRDKYY